MLPIWLCLDGIWLTSLSLIVTTGKVLNMAELSEVHGRAWDDVDVSKNPHYTRNPECLTFRGLPALILGAAAHNFTLYLLCPGTRTVWASRTRFIAVPLLGDGLKYLDSLKAQYAHDLFSLLCDFMDLATRVTVSQVRGYSANQLKRYPWP